METQSLFISVTETARLYGVSPNHVWRELERGGIPHTKMGRRVLIPRQWVEDSAEAVAASAGRPMAAAGR